MQDNNFDKNSMNKNTFGDKSSAGKSTPGKQGTAGQQAQSTSNEGIDRDQNTNQQQDSKEQESPIQFDQIITYVKENWRTLIAEAIAAGVGAYLKHSSTGKSSGGKQLEASNRH